MSRYPFRGILVYDYLNVSLIIQHMAISTFCFHCRMLTSATKPVQKLFIPTHEKWPETNCSRVKCKMSIVPPRKILHCIHLKDSSLKMKHSEELYSSLYIFFGIYSQSGDIQNLNFKKKVCDHVMLLLLKISLKISSVLCQTQISTRCSCLESQGIK